MATQLEHKVGETEPQIGSDRPDQSDVVSVDESQEPSVRKLFAKRSHGTPLVSRKLRLGLVTMYALLLLALIDDSSMRGVGDAGEYYFMADKIAHFHRPQLIPSEIPGYQEEFSRIGGWMSLSIGNDEVGGSVVAKPGTKGPYFSAHAFTYSTLVAPVLRATDYLRMNPVSAFTVVNLVLLCAALWIVLGRLHWAPSLMVFAGPIFWWVDKMHTEVFTFALLAIGLALMRERPLRSMVVLAVVTSQNTPIVGVLALVTVYAVLRNRRLLKMWRFWTASVLSGVIVVAIPLFYRWKLGVLNPQSLNGGLSPRIPSWNQYRAVVTDLNIGMIAGAPIICGLTLVALVVLARNIRRADWLMVAVVGISTAWLLFSFAQTGNFNHGATPGMSRYALWLLPMSLPLFMEVQRLGAVPRKIGRLDLIVPVSAMVVLSMLISTVQFDPKISDGLHRQTLVASWVWKNHPAWENPLPEVFFERTQLTEGRVYPSANSSCNKAIVVLGEWPKYPNCPTSPPPVPAKCLLPESTACYANRDGNHFDYVAVRDVPGRDIPGSSGKKSSIHNGAL